MHGPALAPLVLTAAERETLARWTRRATTAQALALRARLVLACADGMSNSEVALEYRVHRVTVGTWCARFVAHRLDGLLDEPRPGAPRTIADETIEEVLRLTLESTPRDATHWSTRRMGERVGLSQTTVMRIWHAFGLQPHRTETFKLSTDPLFIEKVRDVVGLYLNPPAHALVLSVDAKSQIQALDCTQPMLPLRPGQVERRTHDYVRDGVTSLYAALETRTGAVLGECYPRHRAVEFRKVLDRIDTAAPPDLDVHLILDNASTHKTPLIRRWLAKRPWYHVHFTPTGSSWLNMVERFFSALTTQQLQRGADRSVRALHARIYGYLAAHNRDPKPFIWTKTADDILASVARFCQRTSNSGH